VTSKFLSTKRLDAITHNVNLFVQSKE
jgi:hypothetical protein